LPCIINASDLEREKRLGDQIVDSIMDGDAVYLNAGSHSFLTIFTEVDEANTTDSVIIMHGRGYHPDWENVVSPLRIGLIEHGWNTLSIQMPVLTKKAKYYEYRNIFPESFSRIEASIQYLKKKGMKRIVIIAHSCSVHMSMSWLRQQGDQLIDGFIGIGMGATDYKQPMKQPFPLDMLSVPVFDLYGADEYPAVIRNAGKRLKLIKQAGHLKSKQLMIPDADHYFKDKNEVLLKAVSDWLGTIIK
jgi:hypothetical protein